MSFVGLFLVWSERQYARGMTGKVSRGKLQDGSICVRRGAASIGVGDLSSHSAGPGAKENGTLVIVGKITVGDR